jgi:hypothetical protein
MPDQTTAQLVQSFFQMRMLSQRPLIYNPQLPQQVPLTEEAKIAVDHLLWVTLPQILTTVATA